jgi:hypothetical protein
MSAPARRVGPRAPGDERRRGRRGKPLPEPGAESLQVAAKRARRLRAMMIREARRDPVVFCQYVLRDESDGRRIRLVDMHAEWHDILSRHRRAVIWTFTDAGKTSLISVGRVLWEIGKNPNIRVLLVTAAEGLGKKILGVIKRYIETSKELAEVFPHLKRGASVKKDVNSKDHTVQVVGADSRTTLGARVDLIIIDDFLNAVNTSTEAQRKKHHSILKSTIEGRKGPGCRLWFIGNAWHRRDSMHQYGKEKSTYAKKFPVIDATTGRSRWEARWPTDRIAQERLDRGPVEGPRSLDCDPADENTQWFPLKDVWRALIAGDGLHIIYALEKIPAGHHTITGIDLGVKPTDAADPSAIVSIICDPKGRRRILSVESGRWRGSDIVAKALEHHKRYHSILWVESNGAQDFLRQQLAATPLWDPRNPGKKYVAPVQAFTTTGQNRIDPRFGIQSLAAEMGQGAWSIPNVGSGLCDPTGDNLITVEMGYEVRELVGEALAWSPEAHTGDRLQALWIAREGSRNLGLVETGTKPRGT